MFEMKRKQKRITLKFSFPFSCPIILVNFKITSVCPVAEGHCEVPRGCLYFYSLFFTALNALPCPCTALPLPMPCPVSNLPFAARDRRRKLHRERAMFFFPFVARDRRRKLHRELFFLLLPGTGGGGYTGNSSSSSSPMGGSAPLDSVTVGGGVRFDGSLVAEMDETSVRLDG
jgi:hypothetical protein